MKKAKTMLIQDTVRFSRRTQPETFIILMDNVLGEDEEPVVVKGQWVRAERELEEIYRDAGLMAYAQSGRQTMQTGFRDIVVWALY